MDYGKSFAKVLLSAKKPNEISIKGQSFTISQGTKCSVNNQCGGLRDVNLLARELEFTLSGNGIEMPLVFQLYENTSNHMRLFLYNNKGMLFSVNLTTGYKHGRIDLEQLIKYSSRLLSPAERIKACDDSLAVLCTEGIKIVGEKKVHIGTFDVINNRFDDTTPEKFLLDMIKVGLIKGHYSKNKGFALKLENQSKTYTSANMNKNQSTNRNVSPQSNFSERINEKNRDTCVTDSGKDKPPVIGCLILILIFIIFFW